MEWHLKKVPKIFHAYWGGDILPYIRFMTVYSFMKQNLDWEIMLWMPQRPFTGKTWNTRELKYSVQCSDYYQELFKLPIKIIHVDFREFGFDDNMAENFRSDFMHYYLLHEYGGVCSDMDIVYFRPITNLAVNTDGNGDIETFVCISHYGHSNGFFMASQGNPVFGSLVEFAKKEFNPSAYQSLGPELINRHYPNVQSISKVASVANMGMDAVYAHDAFHIKELFDGSAPKFTENSIGVHWYAGHPMWEKFLAETDGGRTNLTDNIISTALKATPYAE